MGTIKDIVDLTTQLATSVSDRKIADELNKIQSLTLQLQSEQADLHDKNMEIREALVTEKEQNYELRYKIRKLQEKLEEKGKVKYERPSYWLFDGDKKDGPFCQRCWDSDSKLIRLQGGGNDAWHCRECNKSYYDINYNPLQANRIDSEGLV